ncbi:hypothetical protein F2Q68_00014151 [Brassica cretica]|uniref:Uncharacterized protein n=1 Tax=Brassica cretica TaxID=69181 RepID=A0A8S9HLW5_BRACR|nr:hypothetical protein F2Q68_00014151 [Brassica cretica]
MGDCDNQEQLTAQLQQMKQQMLQMQKTIQAQQDAAEQAALGRQEQQTQTASIGQRNLPCNIDILHISIVLFIHPCIGVPHGVLGDIWVRLELKRGDKGDHWMSSAWERPYRSDAMNSLCPTSQSDLTRATTRGRSPFLFRSDLIERQGEVAPAPERPHHSDTQRSLGFVSKTSRERPPGATCRGRCASIIWSNL